MQGFIGALAILAASFTMVVLGLRRARRVRDMTYRSTPPPRAEVPWQETLATEDGLSLMRDGSHNEELLAMGEGARHHKWTITHQS